MANIVRTEILLDDGTFFHFTPQQQNKYNHMADRFSVWGQKISYHKNYNFEALFQEILKERHEKLKNPDLNKIAWRAHVAASIASQVKELGSTFVECGVNIGILSGSILKLLEKTGYGKLDKFLLFDTFTNIPEEQFDEKIEPLGRWHNTNNYTEDIYEYVKGQFAKYDFVDVIQGKVPDVLEKYKDVKDVAYLSLDMNVVFPEKAAIEFFWDKMVTGGVVLLDDYGYINHDPQQDYFDEFCRKRNCVPIQIPTGQAIIIKT